jgi:hypothetical protein
MSTVIVPESMYFGAPTSLTIGGVEVGATLEAPKLAFDVEAYTPEFKNAKGPVKGTTIVRRVIPRLEVLVNELTAVKMAWAMPGATSTVGTAAETGGGLDTTLSSDVAAGATNIKVESVTGIVAGEFLRVGDVGQTEIREILTVGTAGAGGTGVTFTAALTMAHDAGDQVREVDDAGTTLLTWTPGRVPSSAYQDVVAVGPGLDGRIMTVTIFDAISTEPIEMDLDDEAMTGLALSLIGQYDPTTPTVAPFSVELQ